MTTSSSHPQESGSAAEDKNAKVEKDVHNDTDMQLIEVELAAGARAFAFKNYAIATECFSKACEKLNTHHSENVNAVIDAHISYGKALLRNAISLGGLLGGLNNHNLPSESEDTTSQAPEIGGSSSKVLDQTGVASTSKSTEPTNNPNIKNPQIHFSGDLSDEEEDEGDEGDDQVEPTEEPVTVEEELENAFQVLEFARQSIQSQIDSLQTSQPSSSNQNEKDLKTFQNKLVDVHDLIAQVHQEGEQFELAVESYKSSLEIKKSRSNFAPGTIAETHLMIALALELVTDNSESMKQAIEHVDEAIKLMKGHLDNLEKKSELQTNKTTTGQSQDKEKSISDELVDQDPDQKTSKPEEKEKDEKVGDSNKSSSLNSEIEEIKSLINELEAKRDELIEVPQPPPMTEGDKALQAYLAAVNQNTSTASPHAKAVVNDLDSLVKKRSRPIESSSDNPHQVSSNSGSKSAAPPPESPAKKQKTSNSS